MQIHITEGSLWEGFRAFLGFRSKSWEDFIPEKDHAYRRGPIEDRGPCPGLNSLGNHGYLPRDGKNITREHLEAALIVGLNHTPIFAAMLAAPIIPKVGKKGATTFDLIDLRNPHALEHPLSLTRHDYRQGDNYTFQPQMLEDLLKDANGGPITVKTLAATRDRRKEEGRLSGLASLTMMQSLTAYMECAAALVVFGSSIEKETITTFFTEERFPPETLTTRKRLLHFLRLTFSVWWNS